MYSSEIIDELNRLSIEYCTICSKYEEQLILLSEKVPDSAKEHVIYGIARRLSIIRQCVKFFFENMPPNLTFELDSDVRAQGNVNLHAFLINCCGINDNIAWFYAYHSGLDGKMDLEKNKFKIGLFHKRFRQHLSASLLKTVKSFKKWHEFIVGYRHPTAHRIPPYIIPYIQDENTGDIDYTPAYIHSFDKSHPVPLHAQVIRDMGAILELVKVLLNEMEAKDVQHEKGGIRKNNFTEAQIIGVIIQTFSASSMLMGLWGGNGFFAAVLLAILAIYILKPSIDRRKKIRSISGMKELDSLDSQRGHQLLLFLLLFSNAIIVPVIGEISIAATDAFLLYLVVAGILFYSIWKKLGLKN